MGSTGWSSSSTVVHTGERVPSPAEVLAGIIRFVGEILGASSLRFEVGPTLVALGILLVFLQLVARPVSRWVTTDAGGLAGLGRAMALAAEAGTDAVVSLGTAGIARSTDAHTRLQTLAALPVLGHVARAAARSGVPLRVLTNDPLAGVAAASALDAAHASTATMERLGRSRIVVVGEGRPTAGGLVMTTQARPAAAVVAGSLREEATLHLEGLRGGAGSLAAVSAEVAQAPSLLVSAGGALVGAEAYQAAADLRADATERTMVLAANRLILLAAAALALGTGLALAGVIDPRDVLLGIGGA
jgi:hypothetical protein